MNQAFICDAVRTPFGRFGGTLATLRADDLAALPLKALLERNPGLDPARIDDVIYGCANQAGEDNRNVARMALLLAGLPESVPGSTVNRLCGSSLDAIGIAARAIKSGETQLMIAGGVESMSRAPFVMGKAESAFSRTMRMEDTTIGWRFINPQMKALYGVDSMPETALPESTTAPARCCLPASRRWPPMIYSRSPAWWASRRQGWRRVLWDLARRRRYVRCWRKPG